MSDGKDGHWSCSFVGLLRLAEHVVLRLQTSCFGWHQRSHTLLWHDRSQCTRPAVSEGCVVGVQRLHNSGRQGLLECSCPVGPVWNCQHHTWCPVQAEPEELDSTHMGLQRFRKRIETEFSQLNDHLMMIRNYAKQPSGLFARMAAKWPSSPCCSNSIFSIISQ